MRNLTKIFTLTLGAVLVASAINIATLPTCAAAWQPELKVGVLSGKNSIQITVKQDSIIKDAKGKLLARIASGKQVFITYPNGTFLLNNVKLTDTAITIDHAETREQSPKTIFVVNGTSYRGSLELVPQGAGFTVINHVKTEDYLAGVVPEEMPSEWRTDAVQAQAVAARTFALKGRKRHQGDGYDLCATTHCQQYGGVGAEKSAATAAIKATYGEVLTYNGALIEALFHTDSGGMTENSESVWGTKYPYLRAAKELKQGTQAWTKTLPATTVAAAVGKNIGTLKKITLSKIGWGKETSDRTVSGRVKSATFIGDKGRVIATGNNLRSLLGLKSTVFELTLKGAQVELKGYGYGHGLGLSQWGAKALAENGWDYKEILQHYYQGTNLKKLY